MEYFSDKQIDNLERVIDLKTAIMEESLVGRNYKKHLEASLELNELKKQLELLSMDRNFKLWVETNEDQLTYTWDEYKYDRYCGEYFHHDDVDWFCEEFFYEMCYDIYAKTVLKD